MGIGVVSIVFLFLNKTIVCRLIISSRLSIIPYYYYSLHLIYTTTTTSLAAISSYSPTSGGASVNVAPSLPSLIKKKVV